MKREKKMTLFDQWVMGVLIVVVVGFIAYGIFTVAIIQPYSNLQSHMIRVAKDKAGLTSANSFSIVTTDETVYSVSGKNQKGQNIGVLIPKNGNQIQIVHFADGVSASSIEEDNNNAINLGLYKGKTIWEVNSTHNFKIYDFRSGKKIK